ncbi:transglutaminase domain-containing protein [Flavobacterium ponti]|uniref:Transglutaminase domain-containing protein n=1 Tax=Flavobacterium ponti TaxID=665133 RepID=A0ABV9P3B2_9FLAO
MKKIILVFLLFLTYQYNYAQKLKLGNVTKEELLEKTHPIDSSASAAVLFKRGETTFAVDRMGEWSVTTLIEMKIKIYKKEGLEFANHEVGYFVGGTTNESVFFYDTNTFNLEGDKIVKTKLGSEGKFDEEVNENWRIKKITLPAVKEGSIIEFSYKITSPYLTNINDFNFQYSIPVDNVEYTVFMPIPFSYSTVITGYEEVKIEEIPIIDNFYSSKYIYSRQNMPAIRQEKYVNNIKDYTSILKYELASISYPREEVRNVALNWEGVTKSIFDNDKFGRELKLKSYFEEDIDDLIKDCKSDKEKINKIFTHVQKKMNWNEKHSIYTDKGVKKAYKENVGNVADINLMLIAMLRYAGFEANPVLLSTQSNGIAIFPNRTAFNYVIAAIEDNNNFTLLDATNKNSTIDVLPLKTINWYGRLIRKEGAGLSVQIDLTKKAVSNEVTTLMADINDQGNLTGKIRKSYNDYNAFVFRERNGKLSEDSYLESLEKKIKGIEISDYSIKNKNTLEKELVETYAFKQNNAIDLIGSKMYISPLLFFQIEENPFKLDKRKYPVNFPYPFKDSYNIVLKVPEGYEVEFLPKPVSFGMEDGLVKFSFDASYANGNIQINSNLEIAKTTIPSNDYATLKLFYNQMINKQAEKIILKRI